MITKQQAFGMYIGQKTIHEKRSDYIGQLVEVTELYCRIKNLSNENTTLLLLSFQRLILRPFESMTEEEIVCYCKLGMLSYMFENGKVINARVVDSNIVKVVMEFSDDIRTNTDNFLYMTPNQTEYLISIGIDVFNLKERGWAVYESEVSNGK